MYTNGAIAATPSSSYCCCSGQWYKVNTTPFPVLSRSQSLLFGAPLSRPNPPPPLFLCAASLSKDDDERSEAAKGSETTARGRRLLKLREEKRKREYDRLNNYPAWAKLKREFGKWVETSGNRKRVLFLLSKSALETSTLLILTYGLNYMVTVGSRC